MSKQVMLRVPDETYEKLESICAISLRPIATEIMFRLNGTLEVRGEQGVTGSTSVSKTEGSDVPATEHIKTHIEAYRPELVGRDAEVAEVIDLISSRLEGDFQEDADDRRAISERMRRLKLDYNPIKKQLWDKSGEKVKLIHEF